MRSYGIRGFCKSRATAFATIPLPTVFVYAKLNNPFTFTLPALRYILNGSMGRATGYTKHIKQRIRNTLEFIFTQALGCVQKLTNLIHVSPSVAHYILHLYYSQLAHKSQEQMYKNAVFATVFSVLSDNNNKLQNSPLGEGGPPRQRWWMRAVSFILSIVPDSTAFSLIRQPFGLPPSPKGRFLVRCALER